MAANSLPEVIELNVGGVLYATSRTTLTRGPASVIGRWFSGDTTAGPATTPADATAADPRPPGRDSKGRYFVDRDGVLFRYILDYLRNGRLVLPEAFAESARLRQEAEYFGLSDLARALPAIPACGPGSGGGGGLKLSPSSQLARRGSGFGNGDGSSSSAAAVPSSPGIDSVVVGGGVYGGAELFPMGAGGGREQGFLIVGYRGTFQFGRDGLTDVKFRKISRILVSGRVSMCREVFGEMLNESRDPDRGGSDRYSARFFLKHSFIEQAFDALQESGFRMVGACGSGTNSAGESKPGMDSEENRWNHYNEFVFCRP